MTIMKGTDTPTTTQAIQFGTIIAWIGHSKGAEGGENLLKSYSEYCSLSLGPSAGCV